MEEWRDIKGYEGIYQVSNLGRVRSFIKIKSGKILSLTPDKNGYLTCYLYKNSKRKCEKVHRLVAQEFIPNPNNYPQVNHKDETKTNNNSDNLEWCTHEYNHNYGTGNKRRAENNKGKHTGEKSYLYGKKGGKHPTSRKIKCINTGEIFESISEASNKYKINVSNITGCCKGRLKTAGKMRWEYMEE